MNYSQFIGYVTNGPAPADSAELQTFVAEFPYCQTGRQLYSRLLTDTQDSGAEQAVRLAALYAGNRALLRQYLSAAALPDSTPAMAPAPAFLPIAHNAGDGRTSPGDDDAAFTEASPLEPPADEAFLPEPESPAFADEPGPPPSGESMPAGETEDPHEIIRRRLNEIFAARQEPLPRESPGAAPSAAEREETRDIPHPSVGSGETAAAEASTPAGAAVPPLVTESAAPPPHVVPEALPAEKEEVILRKEMMQIRDEVDRDELAHAAGETILQALERDTAPRQDAGKKDFLSWLHRQHAGDFGRVEELRNQPAPALTTYEPGAPVAPSPAGETAASGVPSPSSQALIDQFIAAEPRITPSRAEFYSPAIQARRSVEEDEDLVSETLAQRFFEQGLLEKARSAYQRLRLLVPEKSASFAARIEEIDKKLNEEA